jgi:adenylate kinase
MLNIVISGAPGSGKGTQSAIIVENYGLTHISTGDMLREEIKSGTENGKKAEVLINDGKLVPDEMIIAMLHDQVQKHLENGNTKGYCFCGNWIFAGLYQPFIHNIQEEEGRPSQVRHGKSWRK